MFLHIQLCEVILFLSVRFHSASCDIFYIVKTANSYCPGEFTGVPCLTLQQYASNPSRGQNITVTLIVEPGTYNLSTELTVSNGYNFTMSSSNATVTCTSSTARFSFDSVEKVHISGMTFQMCMNSAIRMTSVTEAHITNSIFVGNVQQSNSAFGGAICAHSSTVTIDESTFSGNSAASTFLGSGGAIYAVRSTITIDQSTISGNIAASSSNYEGRGGGIYAEDSTLTIDQSTFSGNSAASTYLGSGGAIYAVRSTITMDQSTFSDNRAENDAYYFSGTRGGGAINAQSSTITIAQSTFNDNRAYRSVGGAINAWSSTITTDLSTFSGNRANTYGGAIYAQIITVNMSAFYNNVARDSRYYSGGAIYGETVTVDNSEFSYNTAFSPGGAIYGATVTVDRSTFNHNAALTGGAIHGTRVAVERSVFSNNTANSSAGAIHCDGNLQVSSTTVDNNRAINGNGGAIYVRLYYGNGNASVTNCQFINNTVSGDGGAIHVMIYSGNISVANCQLINNTAGGDGGAIHILRNTINYYYYYDSYYSYFYSVVSCQFIENTANSFGGAVYVAGPNSSVNVIDSSFINNAAIAEGGGAIYSNGRYASVILSSTTFNYNSASYCGVLDVDEFDHFSVNFTNSVFTYNTATGQIIGGGVACIRNASINVLNSVFKHNFANNHAGVFYIDGSVTTVDRSIFINNSAALDGGVFYTYIHASDYIIRRSQFSDNAAGDDGGVMLIGRQNCFVSIDESIFDFNSAADRGGVIALIASSMYMEINRTNIFNNTAQFGEVISACNSQVTFVEGILTATVDPLFSFCTLYGGDIRDFKITIPDPETVMTTAPPNTTKLPTTTEVLTTELPTTTAITSLPTRITRLTAIEPHTTSKTQVPDMTPTPSPLSRTTLSSVTTVAKPPATSVIIDKSTFVSVMMDTTSQNFNPTTDIEQISTYRSLDEDINQYENLATVMARVTVTIIISTTCLVVSLVAITIVLIPRFKRCLCKNERGNKSNSLLNAQDSNTDEFTMRNETCSLSTYTSVVFDHHNDDFKKEDEIQSKIN